VGLHHQAGRRHLAQQRTQLGCMLPIALPALQQRAPFVGDAHEHAAYRQAFEEKLAQARHVSTAWPPQGVDRALSRAAKGTSRTT
jgi:hypothetical protein